MELATLCKLKILPQYIFRNTKPAIFGVKVEAGKLTPTTNFISEDNRKIGKIKNIEANKKSVPEATEGMEVAISIPGVNFEKELKDKQFLYSDIGERQFRAFKKNRDLLSSGEMKILSEIAEIKRKEEGKENWGK